MSYFYTSPTSNIPLQPLPTAVRMTRTGSSSSTTSTSSDSSSVFIPSPRKYTSESTSRPGSSSSRYCPSSSTSPSSQTSSAYHSHHLHTHSRHCSSGTSYLPTPFRSSILHSAAAISSNAPSSFFSDEELLPPGLESTFLDPAPPMPRQMTTEEQVAAVREQLEREREAAKPEAWWQQGAHGQQVAPAGKRSRIVRFAGDPKSSATGASGSGSKRSGGGQPKRRSLVRNGNGKGSGRGD